MKRLAILFFLAALTVLPNSASAAQPGNVSRTHTHTKPHAHANTRRPVTAPADEYFGHRRYSILGIRNTLHDLNIRYNGTAEGAPSLYHEAAGLEDAMRDWGKRYRGDLWLAHYLFQLDQLYMRVPAKIGHAKVVSTSHWIIVAYPNTFYSRYLKHIAAVKRPANKSSSPSPKPTSEGTLTPPTEQPTTTPTAEPTPTEQPTTAPTPEPTPTE